MLVRAALGASRLQLVAPLLRESLLLGAVSGALGFGAGFVVLAKLATFRLALGPFPSPSLDLRPDVMVVAVMLILAVALVSPSGWSRRGERRRMGCPARSIAS